MWFEESIFLCIIYLEVCLIQILFADITLDIDLLISIGKQCISHVPSAVVEGLPFHM